MYNGICSWCHVAVFQDLQTRRSFWNASWAFRRCWSSLCLQIPRHLTVLGHQPAQCWLERLCINDPRAGQTTLFKMGDVISWQLRVFRSECQTKVHHTSSQTTQNIVRHYVISKCVRNPGWHRSLCNSHCYPAMFGFMYTMFIDGSIATVSSYKYFVCLYILRSVFRGHRGDDIRSSSVCWEMTQNWRLHYKAITTVTIIYINKYIYIYIYGRSWYDKPLLSTSTLQMPWYKIGTTPFVQGRA